MPLLKTCKEVHTLLLAREDRSLRLHERLLLRLHLLVCDACPCVEQQLFTLRQGLKNWRAYSER
jgi:hypothetical protein